MTWGVVSTIKAEAPAILRFVAYHLHTGAARLYLYLDAPCPAAEAALRDRPEVVLTQCDEAYWAARKGGRPDAHQARQTINATRAYHEARDLEWITHIDVDEFLVPRTPIDAQLAALGPQVLNARARPMELLADGSGDAFKQFVPQGPQREPTVSRLYPHFGEFLKGGFLSHIAGKVFVRTGLPDVKLRIHNVFQNGEMNPAGVELPGCQLAHFHAPSWEAWQRSFHYRFEQGSYRADLGPAKPRKRGGITTHELFDFLMQDDPEAGLRRFFDEVCADSPDLRARLEAEGLLYVQSIPFDTYVRKYFPQTSMI
ncbi:glycosyltransferase family 2 protein [Sulfitobacter sp. S190]|uniref:glycosyltransferase family 2 protein n=1 Tax=Sulfitobacter sp. S190 TaxID=2867022 RepID=UPI0021A47EC2|nr:glycosyltransferase family 2 protein [Sulfitobacter sp. S190]UWR23706.1 glycosyltransferase family 2 protein [Sulfitobacter sp. S190]